MMTLEMQKSTEVERSTDFAYYEFRALVWLSSLPHPVESFSYPQQIASCDQNA